MIEQIGLNSNWQFLIDSEDMGKPGKWYMEMPENTNDIWVPSCWNECSEEWVHYEGVAWYFKKFMYRKNDEIKRNVLFFLGVNYSCEIWLNGQFAGSHTGGFTPFEIDVTALIVKDNENFIAVRVDNKMDDKTVPPIGVDWFNYGGIFREVYLNGTGDCWFDDVFVRTHLNGRIDINVRLGGCNKQEGNQIRITVDDETTVRALLDKVTDVSDSYMDIMLKIKAPKLWSPEAPFLYKFKLTLIRKNKVIDIWEHKIGIRELSIKDRRILLNGRPIMLKGYSKHEEYPMFARTFSRDIVRKDYELCKRGNANFLRLCHYPHHLGEYELASEMGFAVMAEVPNVNFTGEQFADGEIRENSFNQAREMLKYYKNETCILFWSLFIECKTDEDSAVEFVPEYIRLFRETDPTRFTIHASLYPAVDRTYDYFDVVGINYWSGWYYGESLEEGSRYLDEIAGRYPKKPVIMTSGGWEGMYGFHSYKENRKWSEESQAEYLEELTAMYLSKDYIVGEIIWTFNDFRVSPWIISNNAKWTMRPMETNHKGVVDYFRRPKMSYYTMEHIFREWEKKR